MDAGKVPASEHTSSEVRLFQLNLTSEQAQLMGLFFAAGPAPSVVHHMLMRQLIYKMGEAQYEQLRASILVLVDQLAEYEEEKLNG